MLWLAKIISDLLYLSLVAVAFGVGVDPDIKAGVLGGIFTA